MKKDIEAPFEIPQSPQSSMTVTYNEAHQRVELHIRGELQPPEWYDDALVHLYALSEEHDQILIYINTPGGSVATLVEILSILEKFKYVVTVATGVVASAGFTIWCRGNARIVQKYSSLMAHRESYGSHAKTAQMMELAKHIDETYKSMMLELAGSILTPKELEKVEYTEVYLTGDELIKRKVAIPWTDFIQKEVDCYHPDEAYVKIRGILYQYYDPNNVITAATDKEIKIANVFDVIYDVPNYKVTKLPTI